MFSELPGVVNKLFKYLIIPWTERSFEIISITSLPLTLYPGNLQANSKENYSKPTEIPDCVHYIIATLMHTKKTTPVGKLKV